MCALSSKLVSSLFTQLGVTWKAYGFTIYDRWSTGPYPMRCQFVQISLIWGLLDCKLSWSPACLFWILWISLLFFSQRFHIVIFYAFDWDYFSVCWLSVLLIPTFSCFMLSHVFMLFRVLCDRYNLSEVLFKSLTIKCRLIEHLFLETYDYPSKVFPLWSFPFCYFQVCLRSPIVWQVH